MLNVEKNLITKSLGNEAFNLFSDLVDFYETDPDDHGKNHIGADIEIAEFCSTHFTVHPQDVEHVSFFVNGKPGKTKSNRELSARSY